MAQKALIDPNLDAMLRHFSEIKTEASEKRTTSEAIPWFRPKLGDWDGDLQSTQSMIALHKAFNTDEAENALIEAYKPESPGNSSDGIVLSVQIDYAAQAERAYRARIGQPFPRMLAHQVARDKGHGQANGAFLGQALNYFTQILKRGAEGSGGSV
jgi:hypothetical protein